MKKIVPMMISLALTLLLVSCGSPKCDKVKGTIEGNMKTYCEMDDGSWTCNDMTYKYRLEIKGRMPNAASDSVFVYLSNIQDISFEQAWKTSGLSSNTDNYFSVEDAVLVEMSNK